MSGGLGAAADEFFELASERGDGSVLCREGVCSEELEEDDLMQFSFESGALGCSSSFKRSDLAKAMLKNPTMVLLLVFLAAKSRVPELMGF